MSEELNNTEMGPPPPITPRYNPAMMVDAQVGYHRMLLAFSAAILCVSVIFPAPGTNGQVCLPGSDTALPALCMLKREFGIDCPGCGLTRCFLCMGHGRVTSAWHYHPVGVFLFVVVAAQIPFRLAQMRRLRNGRGEIKHWTLSIMLWLLVTAILGQWILRTTGVITF